MLCTLAFRSRAAGDLLTNLMRRALDLLEHTRQRSLWRLVYCGLHRYWYWRGVAEELGTLQELASFLKINPVCANEDTLEIDLDLREGLEKAEQRLDDEGPVAVRIRYGQQPIGHIPQQPGAERLRGAHLRPILAAELAVPLRRVLSLEGAIDPSGDISRQLACLSSGAMRKCR
jgi:hypothetical protein